MSVATPYLLEAPTAQRSGTLANAIAALFLAFPVMGVFFAPEAYFAPQDFAIPTTAPSPVGDYPIGRIGFALLLLWLILRIARDPALFLRGVAQAAPPLLFALYVMASALWAGDPLASFNRAGRALILALFAIDLAQHCNARQLLRLISVAVAIAIVASIIAIITPPHYGYSAIAGYHDAWRGALTHKNAFGALMSLGVVFGYYALALRACARPIAAFTLIASAILLVGSRSATAIMTTLALVPSAYFLNAFGAARSGGLKIVVLIAALLAALMSASALLLVDDFIELTGRSDTWTGRAAIWRAVGPFVDARPLLGHGHGFWSTDGAARAMIWRELNWAPPHAHNNYIDLWLQFGLVGLAIASATLATAIARGVRVLIQRESAMSVLWLLVMMSLLLRSLTEATFVDPNISGMFWLTLGYAALTRMAIDLRALKRAAEPRAVSS